MLGAARTVAGYDILGTAGLEGKTYAVNIWGLTRTEGATGGLFGLSNALRAEASAAGASEISITGSMVAEMKLMNPTLANSLGYSYTQVGPTTFVLRAPIR
jgi:hypothetical protein